MKTLSFQEMQCVNGGVGEVLVAAGVMVTAAVILANAPVAYEPVYSPGYYSYASPGVTYSLPTTYVEPVYIETVYPSYGYYW